MNRIYLMNSLQQIKRNPAETVDSFYMRVQEKINPLNLDQMTTGELKQLITLSQLVNFCTNNGLKKGPGGSVRSRQLSEAIDRAEQQAKEIADNNEAAANRVGTDRGSKNKFWWSQQQTHGRGTKIQLKKQNKQIATSWKENAQCYKRGGTFLHQGSQCPALRVKCHTRQKIGHCVECYQSGDSTEPSQIALPPGEWTVIHLVVDKTSRALIKTVYS